MLYNTWIGRYYNIQYILQEWTQKKNDDDDDDDDPYLRWVFLETLWTIWSWNFMALKENYKWNEHNISDIEWFFCRYI